jgi:hypothetical protein
MFAHHADGTGRVYAPPMRLFRREADADVTELAARYRELLVERDAASDNPRKANRLWDRNHRCYKALRETGAGREAIAAMMDDPLPAVRLTAAAHAIFWEERRARRVLEAIAEDADRWEHGMSAEMVLREFDAGTLSHDW